MFVQDTAKEVEHLADELLANETEYFKVGFKVKPTNNFKLYIDGDKGVDIDQYARFNRALRKLIEERNWFPAGDFSLEVSSPGVDEPLKNIRQYKKNIGRLVEITLSDENKKTGVLKSVSETEIIIEQKTGKGKSLATQQLQIPFQNIKTITVQIQF